MVSSEYIGPFPDPDTNRRQASTEPGGELSPGPTTADTQAAPPAPSQPDLVDPQFSPREHVTGALPAHPAVAPRFQPAYWPYPPPGYPPPAQGMPYPYLPRRDAPYPAYQGYPGYPGYSPA